MLMVLERSAGEGDHPASGGAAAAAAAGGAPGAGAKPVAAARRRPRLRRPPAYRGGTPDSLLLLPERVGGECLHLSGTANADLRSAGPRRLLPL